MAAPAECQALPARTVPWGITSTDHALGVSSLELELHQASEYQGRKSSQRLPLCPESHRSQARRSHRVQVDLRTSSPSFPFCQAHSSTQADAGGSH